MKNIVIVSVNSTKDSIFCLMEWTIWVLSFYFRGERFRPYNKRSTVCQKKPWRCKRRMFLRGARLLADPRMSSQAWGFSFSPLKTGSRRPSAGFDTLPPLPASVFAPVRQRARPSSVHVTPASAQMCEQKKAVCL